MKIAVTAQSAGRATWMESSVFVLAKQRVVWIQLKSSVISNMSLIVCSAQGTEDELDEDFLLV